MPRKKPLKNWMPSNTVEVVYGTAGNFNETVICESYIPRVLVDYKYHNRFQSLDIMFYQAPFHTMQRSRATFASASIDVKWIPKLMAPFLQHVDHSWMRPIKLAYGRKWNNWLRTVLKAYTPAGNMKPPGYTRVFEWIAEAWD